MAASPITAPGKPAPAPTYKKYIALLTQTGTNAPVATILENDLGFVPTFGYDEVGLYRIIGTFPNANKTVTFLGVQNANGYFATVNTFPPLGGGTHIPIESAQFGSPANDVIGATPIEIRIYP